MKALLEASDDKAAIPPTPGQKNPPYRILLVEDDREVRHVNIAVLLRSGYEVAAAEDGAAAWEALSANSYDLLITDHNMPRLTGVELLKKLSAAHMALPSILISGAMPTEELKRHPWLQIEATLLKPFTTDELLATVRNILRATDGAREQLAPPPNWQSQPSAVGLQS